jgi:hypothetical protein
MKKLLITIAVTLFAPLSIAGVWVNPGFYSHHFDTEKNLNNNNGGFGVEANVSHIYSLTAGVFKNSDRVTSHYVGAYVMPIRIGTVKMGAAFGAFDGYPQMRDGGWFPAVVPTMAIEGRSLGLNVSFIPKIGERVHSALSFQVKYNLAP